MTSNDLPYRIEPQAFDGEASVRMRFVYTVEDAVVIYNALMERAHVSMKERVLARRVKTAIETGRFENKI